MIYKDIPQGSPEWHFLRAGKVTASKVSDVKAKSRDGKGEGLTRRKYRIQLITEWLTGQPSGNTYTNEAMERGNEMEPIARAAYEAHTGQFVEQITFATHDDILCAGASPDGLVGDDGLVEIKCPNSHTHFNYITEGVVPTEYKDQMLWQCACMKRQWVDFVSFDNRFPVHMQLFVVRYTPTAEEIAALEAEVVKFLDEARTVFEHWNRVEENT